MRLKTTLPPELNMRARAWGLDEAHFALCIACDFSLDGETEAQYLVAQPGRLAIVSEKKSGGPVFDLALTDEHAFRNIPVLGTGLLQVKDQGRWIDLARYASAHKYHFHRLARRLTQLAKGEPLVLVNEDEIDPCRCPRCGLMRENAGETCPRCIDRRLVFRRILQMVKPYWPAALIVLVLLVFGVTLDIVSPLLTKFLIDEVLKPLSPNALRSVPFMHLSLAVSQLLPAVVMVLASVQVLRTLVNILNGRLATRVGTALTRDIRGRMVEHLEKLSLAYYDRQQIGSLVSRVAHDTDAVQGFMLQLSGGFLLQILMVALSVGMMFHLEPKLAIWTLVPAPFVLFGTLIFTRYVQPLYRRLWDRSSKQAGMLSGLLSGIRVIKSFAQEKRELERFQSHSNGLRAMQVRLDLAAGTFFPAMGLLFQVGGWIIWYVGGHKVLSGTVSLGTLMAFLGYLWMFYGPLSQLTNLSNWVTQFSVQMHRIFEVLDTPVVVADAENPTPMPSMRGDITFQDVSFGYVRQQPILKEVSFDIAAGQRIGVVGRSGSGKTTLINLLMRFYDVEEGAIFVDGVDLRQLARVDIHRQVGVVLQEPFLFRGSLWENLTYGQSEAPEEKVIAAAKAGNCHDFIMKQLHAYDTWVGERGSGLSGGERQRLSIARALLCEPRILILDEATSSVDSESELQIQQALGELTQGRTSIIIAHRLTTLRTCDRILVMDEGRVVESGNHDELMKIDGRYARMVKIQGTLNPKASVDDVILHDEESKKQRKVLDDTYAVKEGSLPPLGGHRVRWLDPGVCQIENDAHGALKVTAPGEKAHEGVFALRVMPVQHSERYISLRDYDDENREREIGIIRDLAPWPAAAQQAVRRALSRRYFVFEVKAVTHMSSFQNYLSVSLDTDRGVKSFIMRYGGATATPFGENGKMLVDVEDNRYLIADVSSLPPKDRALFERYIYW